MSKKFNIREWVLSVKYWSLLFIPHVSICLIFLIYTLVGASIIQEIESDDFRSTTTSSSLQETITTTTLTTTSNIPVKNFDRERERLLSKIIDKRQTIDLLQYTKYINKHIREFEDELKKTYQTTSSHSLMERSSNNGENPRWSFSGSLFFIGTTLTTIGSNDFLPVTKIGKLFLMIYAAIGIPLTLVFLSDLSLLITRLIKYLSLLLLRVYSTHYFLSIRQWTFIRWIENHLHISIPIPTDEDEIFSSQIDSTNSPISFEHFSQENDPHLNQSPLKRRRLPQHIQIKHIRTLYNILIDTLKDVNDETDLTMSQLIITVLIYILIGACLITSNSYFDSVYICFTSLFTINLSNFFRNSTSSQELSTKAMFIFAIYILFGVAIVSLCITTVQIRIQTILADIGTKLLRDLVEFLRQMGFHELSTDDILCTTDMNSYSTIGSLVDTVLVRQRLTRTSSSTSESTTPALPISLPRPIGIAEPVRRLSSGLIIRSFKRSDEDTNNDKSVQVNTIIRSCGRCAGSNPTSALSVKKHNAVSSSPSSPGEMSSGCEDDDVMPQSLQPPNLDRLRQRRATLVAKTIINQMATQPPVSMIDEPMPALTLLTAQRHRLSDPTKHHPKKTLSPPAEAPRKRGGVTQEEFLEISKQISSLLTPSDDEN